MLVCSLETAGQKSKVANLENRLFLGLYLLWLVFIECASNFFSFFAFSQKKTIFVVKFIKYGNIITIIAEYTSIDIFR
jgi:hypothetical protein